MAAPPRQIEDRDPLAHDLAHRHPRVERRVRILEDVLHAPPHGAQLGVGQARDVDLVEDDAAERGLVQPEDRAREGALARARLADDAQRLAAADVERDAVDRVDEARVRRRGRRARGRASRACRPGGAGRGTRPRDAGALLFAHAHALARGFGEEAPHRAAAAAIERAAPPRPCSDRSPRGSAPGSGSRAAAIADRAASPRWSGAIGPSLRERDTPSRPWAGCSAAAPACTGARALAAATRWARARRRRPRRAPRPRRRSRRRRRDRGR